MRRDASHKCFKLARVGVFKVLRMAHVRDTCAFETKLQVENLWIHVGTIRDGRGATNNEGVERMLNDFHHGSQQELHHRSIQFRFGSTHPARVFSVPSQEWQDCLLPLPKETERREKRRCQALPSGDRDRPASPYIRRAESLLLRIV